MENGIEGFIERIQGLFMKLMSAGLAWLLQLSVTGVHWHTQGVYHVKICIAQAP